MKRKITVGELKRLIANESLLEARKGVEIPPELSDILKLSPLLKLSKTPDGWLASVKITEKDQNLQQKQFGHWLKIKAILSKRPWKLLNISRDGWDGQTDTGDGNYSASNQQFIHPSGLIVSLSSTTNFRNGTKFWTLTARNSKTNESLLREDDSTLETKEAEDSLDSQVDKYLLQYETEAKNLKTEGHDFRAMLRRILSEAEDDEPKEETPTDVEPTKLSADDFDVTSFANSVTRLIENYDSLLEVRNTLVRRAKNYLGKAYTPDVVKLFEETMREEHGISPGESKIDIDAEEFAAPAAARAGGDGGGAAG